MWEIDLYGPLPLSKQGSSYIFTAIDMFIKYVVAYPINSKDDVTLAQAFIKIITNFGVCKNIIGDQGSGFIAKITSEHFKMLHVTQKSLQHSCNIVLEHVNESMPLLLRDLLRI